VHAFLFSDMLLICKSLSKKQTGAEGKVRIIRQPFLVDRLVVGELGGNASTSSSSSSAAHHLHHHHHMSGPTLSTQSSTSSSGPSSTAGPSGLACVYLNEYNVASSAFTLHSSESSALKAWHEQIGKARELYREAKAATARQALELQRNSASASLLLAAQQQQANAQASGDEELRLWAMGAAAAAAVVQLQNSDGLRRGSFRGSRLSSIGHSYSGSVEMNSEVGSGCSGASAAHQLQQLQLQLQHQYQAHQQQLAQLHSSQQQDAANTSGVRRNRSFELQVGVGVSTFTRWRSSQMLQNVRVQRERGTFNLNCLQ